MSSNLPVRLAQRVPEVPQDLPGPLELPVRQGRPGQLGPLDHPERQGSKGRLELAAQLVLRAIEVIRGLPVLPDRADLMGSLDLLGRVVRLVSAVLREKSGPLGRLELLEPKGIRDLRESLGHRGLAERLDLLEFEVRLGVQDPLVLLALALLVQRDLLELDPPD